MAYYPEFGRLFTIHLNKLDKPKNWIAEQLGVNLATIYRWEKGESRPKDVFTVLRIADVLEIRDTTTRRALLRAADYAEHFAKQSLELVQPSSQQEDVIDTATPKIVPPNSDVIHYERIRMLTYWENATASSLRSIVEHSGWGHVLFLLIGLILWQLSAEFITPVFAITLSPEKRLTACLGYAIATVVIPIIIGLITPPQSNDISQSERQWLRYRIRFLQTTGAVVAFHTFLISFLLLTVMWHSMTRTTLPVFVHNIMIIASLLMSYVYARKILEGRFQIEQHDIRLYSADYLFSVVFVLIGPLTAFGIYYFAEQISSQPIGMGVLWMLLALALWEYRKQNTKALSELGMITILGAAIPFCLLLIFTLSYSPTFLTIENTALFGIFVIFFLAETLLVATLLMRNKPTLTIQGMVALLILAYTAVLVIYLHLWSGFLWVILALFMLIASGRTSFRTYFWVHDSFWVLQIGTIAAIWVFAYDLAPVPFTVLGFVLLSAFCTFWAFHNAQNSPLVKQQTVS